MVRSQEFLISSDAPTLHVRYYTWSVYPIDNNIEFVPMFWGNSSIGEWTMTAKNTLAQMTPKVTTVLGMNEWVLFDMLTCDAS